MNFKKLIFLIIGISVIIGIIIGINFYNKIFKPNTVKEGFIYVPTNSNYTTVYELVKPYLKHPESFNFIAKLKKYPHNIKPGKYKVLEGMSNNKLINILRNGRQTPVKLSFNNQDSFEKLAGRISQQIEADSVSLLNAFKDEVFLNEHGFTPQTALGMYIPNTYEFYWNTSANLFRSKMNDEYNRFWNNDRLAKAKKLNLSKNEVITLASIVQKETATVNERPMVAKLYLNRLQEQWPLQADPTIIFAIKQQFGEHLVIKRVLTKDLEIKSPYNTYKNIGLPPGLIAMPDISSIDAVLNPASHNYFFMCASTTKIGTHDFATTLAEHNRNAAKYQIWLSKQGVNR